MSLREDPVTRPEDLKKLVERWVIQSQDISDKFVAAMIFQVLVFGSDTVVAFVVVVFQVLDRVQGLPQKHRVLERIRHPSHCLLSFLASAMWCLNWKTLRLIR